MPEEERRVIWGMMVGEEGKTRIPVLEEFRRRGFDPTKHKLQSYGSGWKSASFLPQERQLFGLPGGLAHDWNLQTSLEGVYAAGDQLFASNCMGHASATGHYAGRHAADHAAATVAPPAVDESFVEAEHLRVLAPMTSKGDLGWKELNMALAKAMQLYCGSPKHEVTLVQGLALLEEYEKEQVPQLLCENPHDLMRALEVVDILTVSKLILHACLQRRSSSRALCFERVDFPEVDPEQDRRFILVRNEGGTVKSRELPLDFHGDLAENYARHNAGNGRTVEG
jgi:succinate dehydrogenase/fumarate reductase flavoprotein subunit